MKRWRWVFFLLAGLCFSGFGLAQEQASNYWQNAKQCIDSKAAHLTSQYIDPGEGGGSSGGGSSGGSGGGGGGQNCERVCRIVCKIISYTLCVNACNVNGFCTIVCTAIMDEACSDICEYRCG